MNTPQGNKATSVADVPGHQFDTAVMVHVLGVSALANWIGVAPSTVRRWRAGATPARPNHRRLLRDAAYVTRRLALDHDDATVLDLLTGGGLEVIAAGRALELLERDQVADDLDPAIWGPRPSQAEVLAAKVRSRDRTARARAEVLEQSLTRGEAARRLGVGVERISTLVAKGELVALDHEGDLHLPDWQFHPDTSKGHLGGIRESVAAGTRGGVALTQWMTRPNPALQGRSPAQALADGDVDMVVAAALAGV